jgi:hypothetical protein
MSHPGQQLTLSFLPWRLVHISHEIVEKHHKINGYASLVTHLWHRDTNGFIAVHKDLFSFLHNAVLLWKVRRFCFVVAAALLIASVLVSWWILVGLIPIFVIVPRLTKRVNTYYSLIAALLLAVEIAGNDFGGWVSGLPDVRSTASDRLGKYVSESKTRFLDFYMPNRAEVSQSELTDFARIIKTDFDLGQPDHIREVEAIFERS